MSKLTYPEAVKKAKAEKPKDNYMVVQIDGRLILPHRDGIQLLAALASAERLSGYSGDPPLEPLTHYTVQSSLMSAQDYERHRIAALMGVSLRALEEAEKATENQQP